MQPNIENEMNSNLEKISKTTGEYVHSKYSIKDKINNKTLNTFINQFSSL